MSATRLRSVAGSTPDAMRFIFDRMKLVAEPSGAITVAALLGGLAKAQGPTVCLLSGGNIEYDGVRALFDAK